MYRVLRRGLLALASAARCRRARRRPGVGRWRPGLWKVYDDALAGARYVELDRRPGPQGLQPRAAGVGHRALGAPPRRDPAGSVVMVRLDWSKRWPDPALTALKEFPGVSLEALQFLHLRRHILFHKHGARIGEVAEAPLRRFDRVPALGSRRRDAEAVSASGRG